MQGPHGHVTPRPDGMKARCGCPAICPQCVNELAAKQAAEAIKDAQIAHLSAEVERLRAQIAVKDEALWGCVALLKQRPQPPGSYGAALVAAVEAALLGPRTEGGK